MGAPYFVQKVANTCQCKNENDEEEENHYTSFQTWHNRHRQQHKQEGQPSDNPYELLQELLKEGGLIKEAVRRINYVADEQVKCFDYEKDDYESSSSILSILPPF